MDDTRTFFHALWGDEIPEGARILIWSIPSKRSIWCPTLEDAAAAAQAMSGQDVYFGIGLSGKDYGPDKRCQAVDTIGIPGLWADFDVQGPGHQKRNLPPSREAILELLAAAGLRPTLAVDSGRGIHCYYLFPGPWIFQSAKEREQAALLARRWNNTLRLHAKSRGWDLDATWDLARVLRVPGTLNRKVKGEAVPVKIIWHDPEIRYTTHDIEAKLIDDDRLSGPVKFSKDYTEVVITENLVLDAAAEPPFEKFDILKEADQKFANTWERCRKDMQDQSNSAYDMALASIAARANWSDQEIVNLLIAHRRKHGVDPKLRHSYFKLTLENAKRPLQIAAAIDDLRELAAEELPQAACSEEAEAQQDEQREKILKHLSGLFGFDILKIIKFIGSEPTYRLETDRGGIMLGDVDGLINQKALRKQVAALSGHYLPVFKPTLWDSVAQQLLNAVEEQDTGEEGTDEGVMRSWLSMFISAHGVSKGLHDEVIEGMTPYRLHEDGPIFVFGQGFQDWLRRRFSVAMTHKQFGVNMRLIGAIPKTEAVTIRGKATTRSVWQVPASEGEEVV